ncbi:MAG: hypothetical protein KDK70_35435 [Myxococcales bacterium]|nr:hypothetical protein [Myxococcales bacterium]
MLGLAVLGGVVVLAAALVSFANAVPGNLDDAFITLVYARHLLDDGSLYWNLADGPIDGFTSLLDVVLKAAALAVADDPLAMARDLSLATHAIVGLVCMGLVAATGPERGGVRALGAGTAVGLAVSLHPAPAHGASFLLESSLAVGLGVVATALPLGVDLVARPGVRRAWIGVLMLACLVRPEAQALAVGSALLHAVVLAPAAPRGVRLSPLLAVAATLVAYYAWHALAFGALLPNTFYAKSSASRGQELADGWAYLMGFVGEHGLLGALTLVLPLVVPLPLLRGGWRPAPARRRHALVSLAAAATLALVVVEGGDSYTGGRFLALPAVLSLVACGHLTLTGPRLARALA